MRQEFLGFLRKMFFMIEPQKNVWVSEKRCEVLGKCQGSGFIPLLRNNKISEDQVEQKINK